MRYARRQNSLRSLKAKAWQLFSILVRKGGADKAGKAACVTCGVKRPWKEMQAGHFLSRVHLSILFDRRNVSVQCPRCNGPLRGNLVNYTLWMQKTYGQKVIDELLDLKRESVKFSRSDYQEMIEQFGKEIEGL